MPRPAPQFRGFIGQKPTVDMLKHQLAGAKELGEPFPATCFTGPSGVGKTLLARCLAAEYGTELIATNGFQSPQELAAQVKQLNECDFLFIDEAHNLSAKAQEMLYRLIDAYEIPAWAEENKSSGGPKADGHVSVRPATLILASDQPGRLHNALQKRMVINVRLGYYAPRELKEIVDRVATNLKLRISPQASGSIANVSAGLPRRAEHHLENLRRHFPNVEQIGVEEVRRFFADFGVDEQGLGQSDRLYLQFLGEHGTASLEALSLHLGTDVDDVRRQIEPALQRSGMITIGQGGRRLSQKGRQWVDTHVTHSGSSQ